MCDELGGGGGEEERARSLNKYLLHNREEYDMTKEY